MAKLTDDIGGGAIGRDGLVRFCNEMNEEKANAQSRVRFSIADQDGRWTLVRYQLHRGADLNWFAYVASPSSRDEAA